jgi:hypothetical protein
MTRTAKIVYEFTNRQTDKRNGWRGAASVY